ncbi:MAG: methionyl-tRNA formyltransferase [Planctomycetaceae bacterium]|jgi:methionyl-tRNA formyltransferase|nr:methionyl-tRNA formyltransferase [Planctomycetaceae bacterium]
MKKQQSGQHKKTEAITSVPLTGKRFQIVLMATGAFAVPAMRLLCEEKSFDISCLVTNPLRYDRHGKAIITPARQLAAEYDIAVSDKDDVHSQEFFDFLYLVRPDLLFVCDFGHILPKRALEGSLLGGINLHGSLLPKYRGAAPIHWALLNGEQYTGVSIIHITAKIDAGPVIAQSPPIPIGIQDTAAEIEERLAEYGAELVFDVVSRMASSRTIKIIEQVHEKASKAPKLKKENGLIPWNKTAKEIYNHCRAMEPWPRSFTDWYRPNGTAMRLILGGLVPLTNLLEEEFSGTETFVDPMLIDAKMDNLAELLAEQKANGAAGQQRVQRFTPKSPAAAVPGTVLRAEGGELIVSAGAGAVKILSVQPAGKKMMPVKDFLQGHGIRPGDILK